MWTVTLPECSKNSALLFSPPKAPSSLSSAFLTLLAWPWRDYLTEASGYGHRLR